MYTMDTNEFHGFSEHVDWRRVFFLRQSVYEKALRAWKQHRWVMQSRIKPVEPQPTEFNLDCFETFFHVRSGPPGRFAVFTIPEDHDLNIESEGDAGEELRNLISLLPTNDCRYFVLGLGVPERFYNAVVLGLWYVNT